MKPDILISIGTLILLCAIFFIASVTLTSQDIKRGDYTQYAIVFKPNTPQMQIIEKISKADGYPVRNTNIDFLFIAASKTSDFKSKIRELGAIAVFNPVIKGNCITTNKTAFATET